MYHSILYSLITPNHTIYYIESIVIEDSVSEPTRLFPVVQRGNPAMQLGACLKASLLWRHVQILGLTKNMRAHITGDVNSRHFAAKLLKIGNIVFLSFQSSKSQYV